MQFQPTPTGTIPPIAESTRGPRTSELQAFDSLPVKVMYPVSIV